MLKDRYEAGVLLSKKLEQYRGTSALVLAIPRGGVIVGQVVARTLKLPFDIICVRKVGHPGDPEYAICAVDEAGLLLCNEPEVKDVPQAWLKSEIEAQQREARRRARVYRGIRRVEDVAGRTVIIIDDGVATNLTMRLATKSVKAKNPEKIIVAVPVAPLDALDALKREGADEVIVLEPPEEFVGAVGAHYEEFEQVEDDKIIRLMKTI